MPIELNSYSCAPTCFGFAWTINNEDLLARYVAHLLMGHFRYVSHLINKEDKEIPGLTASAIKEVIRKLKPPNTKEERWHRDGWLFQMISWVAAKLSSDSHTAITAPHTQPTEKGVDSLMVHLDPSHEILSFITISEEKATTNDRSMIRDKVWPEFRKYETGQRDSELLNVVTATLERFASDHVDKLIENIFWKEQRYYRVSITCKSDRDNRKRKKALFKGYDEVVEGDLKRRRAETLNIDNLRDWMDAFCRKLIKYLKK